MGSSNENEDKPDISEKIQHVRKIRNKHLRMIEFKKQLKLKKKIKKEERKKRRQQGIPKGVPKTLETLREPDQTVIKCEEDKEELQIDVTNSEFGSYFAKSYEPKVLITYSNNPSKKTWSFGRELCRIIPNAFGKLRKHIPIKKVIESCKREEFTDIVVVNENMKMPNGLLVIHLPDGPTANFRLSNVKITPELKRDYKEISTFRPEVILNNFTTRLGNTVASMLAALFHYDPQFKGRRAVTFHNQRDYIFFRHHRYEFKANGTKVGLRELGPRFTLKLRSLQHGTFDSKTGEYEWIISGRRHEMETSRRRFFL
ncbi:probable ribosome production factor 1 [Anabrus simplex]|uniref:probable ribosome production factor 1 n=1 Tax=Anabrus simplex TaxID=316456 RepID=UPI0035A30D7A